MPKEKEQFTLYGEQAERFREIWDDLEDDFGYRPKRPHVVGELMRVWPEDT